PRCEVRARFQNGEYAVQGRNVVVDDDVLVTFGPENLVQVQAAEVDKSKPRAAQIDTLHLIWREALTTKSLAVEQDFVEVALEHAISEYTALEVDLAEIGIDEDAIDEVRRLMRGLPKVGAREVDPQERVPATPIESDSAQGGPPEVCVLE